MKVGDMVIRAYVWDRDIPGIIVGEDLAESADWNESQDWYTVAWSDGMLTNETRVELEHWGDMNSESR
jgi:hypothetical protein